MEDLRGLLLTTQSHHLCQQITLNGEGPTLEQTPAPILFKTHQFGRWCHWHHLFWGPYLGSEIDREASSNGFEAQYEFCLLIIQPCCQPSQNSRICKNLCALGCPCNGLRFTNFNFTFSITSNRYCRCRRM